MNDNALFWLSLNFLTIIILAFYSMQEMACVSFNKVRLQYYVSKGNQRAIWLRNLLQNPSRLFGTTLIGVNVATIVGSECAREFHRSIGLDPNWAPLSQVILVVILGELAPMFAARHYPEHVAMAGIPIVYASSKVAAPILWILSAISNGVSWLLGNKSGGSNTFLSQEELQKVIEDQEEDLIHDGDLEEINQIASNIFRLRGRDIQQIMTPLSAVPMLPSNATIIQMVNVLKRTRVDFIPIYHQHYHNIIGIARPRELIRIPDTRRIRDYCEAPWFVTKGSLLTDVLQQFRKNNESVTIVIDEEGTAIGLVTLDDLINEIFGKSSVVKSEEPISSVVLQNRTFPGDMLIKDFNRLFHTHLIDEEDDDDRTLSKLIKDVLGHPPEVGDTIVLTNFELSVKEASLLDVKTVSVNTKNR